jgi:4-amino-4-deoxy-L-arabinose transferase-like glycosyltransferase
MRAEPGRPGRQWAWKLVGVALLALAVRAAFPLADPPWLEPIGITWHDEGVWAHNARNKALFGAWRMDAWNPMYVSPVFTGLEFLSFALFGVGLWQARVISIAAGVTAAVALAGGLRAFSAPGVALTGGVLLAVNYMWVMYSRVALLEATMIAAMVAAWACYARADRDWRWGALAALLGLVAFFTKASAAFFLVALGLDACWMWWRAEGAAGRRGAVATLGVLAAGTALSILVFVAPNWTEYSFYNLYVYGSRRSAMGLTQLVDRASWLPVIHGFFSRQWLLTMAALAGLAATVVRHRTAPAGERLLALWFLLGTFELVLHDLGNERRYVFLVPAMAGLAAILISGHRHLVPPAAVAWSRGEIARWSVLLAAGAYVLAGGLTRTAFMPDVGTSVRSAAAVAAVAVAAVIASWPRLRSRAAALSWSPRVATMVVLLVVAGDAVQYARWAGARTYHNHDASVAIGRLLPPGTLVQGKLANGLALDNGIRPLFIGPGFGNYADRFDRPDADWILTYSRPRLGFEGAVVREVLDRLPGWEIRARFAVAETRLAPDEAILIRKPDGKYN